MHVSSGSRGGRGRGGRAGFPVGTKLFFPQATVPVGWTLDITHNDKAIRIVNTTGGGSGGSSPFSTVFGKTATDATTLTTAQIAAHQHTNANAYIYQSGANANFSFSGANSVTAPVESTNNAGGGGSHTHGMDIRTHYVDTVIGKKN
jgi:hypothetical protein